MHTEENSIIQMSLWWLLYIHTYTFNFIYHFITEGVIKEEDEEEEVEAEDDMNGKADLIKRREMIYMINKRNNA